ncbi:hypothetical protein ACOMHN_001025 [Nucella lapillus]
MRSDRRGLASFPRLPPQTYPSSPGQTCPGDAGPRNTRVQPAIGITESAQQGVNSDIVKRRTEDDEDEAEEAVQKKKEGRKDILKTNRNICKVPLSCLHQL